MPRVYAAYHFMRAGLFARAVPAIETFVEFIERHPGADIIRKPVVLDMLESIVTAPNGTFDRTFLEWARAHGANTIALELALAGACAEVGDSAAAERWFESAHGALHARGATGLHMRQCLDVGARIALRCQDHRLFAERSRASGSQVARSSLLACEAGSLRSARSSPHWSFMPATGHERTAVMRFESALARLAHGPTRHADLLQLLCDHVDASGGVLYVARGGRVARVAATSAIADLAALDAEIGALHARELTSSAEVTVAASSESRGDWNALHTRKVDDCILIPYGLLAERGGIRQLVGIAVLAFENPEDASVAHGWLSAMAGVLEPTVAT